MAVDVFNSFRYESIIIYFQVISKAYITSKANSRKHTKKRRQHKKNPLQVPKYLCNISQYLMELSFKVSQVTV